ncbi:META domain-containing protein [Pseudomonas songnenensis]|uniref:META domain-containing protein n=1 Tax=Pseudomonas songnenensis TaxID=1176259 RepID=A0ABX9UWP1_9PSED|nr:META domain-containing protein [Pseudomonas songnenensis]MCQ4301228.1 META domain-containing protein [Pseudomonas songnenensis]RMH97822.1 META domain-containing protein [Pseudomonas songnenensis]
MTLRMLPLVVAIGLAGCATEPLELQRDVTYIAEWIGDEPVVGRTAVSLTLSEGRAYGNAGCNHWFGSYEQNGQQIRFSNLGSTRKLCPEEIMEQEHAFLDLLNRVERWDVSNIDQLRLWPAEGSALRLWPEQE